MKKIFTAILSLAVCATVGAQTSSLKILGFGLGVPGEDEPQLIGLDISPNGKYVCGLIEMGGGYFVADIENNIYSFAVSDDPEGAELRHVDNNGLAIGFNGPGVTYSIDDVETVLKVPSEEYKYVLGEDISNDGSVMVGSLVDTGYATYAAYSKDGGEWTPLPQIDDEQLAELASEGCSAKYVSGDGKVILGFAGSFGPAIMWVMNDEGEYELDPLFTRYMILTEDDMVAGEKVFSNLTPANLSNNGKYALLTGVIEVEDEIEGLVTKTVPVVYDVEAKEITIYSEPQEIDMYGLGLTPTAIADDGTFIGIIGTLPMYACFGSFIWKSGEEQAQSYSEAFPCYAEMFGFYDLIGNCVPTSLSADGRYLQGYGFYSPDFEDEEAPAYFATYVIDTQSGTTGIEATPSASAPATVEGIYSIDGKRIDRMAKGINIVRMSDGTSRKVIK